MRFNGLVLAVVALLAGAVYSQDNTDAKSDKQKLQGEWKPVSMKTEGTDVTAGLAKVTDGSDLIAFDGDKMVSKQGTEKKSLPFKLDPVRKPKELDLDAGDGKTVIRAIYKLDGDDLTICFSLSEKQERPTDFDTKSGSQTMTWAYKRHKR
jgi:uncharacterized protein (TIGR03067 family)